MKRQLEQNSGRGAVAVLPGSSWLVSTMTLPGVPLVDKVTVTGSIIQSFTPLGSYTKSDVL